MAPRTQIPQGGPDQDLFMFLFGLGFLIGLVGYLVGSKTLRLIGIVMILFATALFVGDVATEAGDGGSDAGMLVALRQLLPIARRAPARRGAA